MYSTSSEKGPTATDMGTGRLSLLWNAACERQWNFFVSFESWRMFVCKKLDLALH